MSKENNKIQTNSPSATPPESIKLPQFWEKIGCDLDKGVEKFNEDYKTKLSSTLAAAIAECFNEDSFAYVSFTKQNENTFLSHRTSRGRIFRLFWNEKGKLFLVFLILLMVGGLAYLLWTNFEEMKNRVMVRRPSGLPAFHIITPEDLRMDGKTPELAANRINTLAGRFVLSPVPENSAVTEKDLLRRELNDEMGGRIILPIPVNPKLVDDYLTPNRKISLTLVKNKEPFEQSAIITDVILLGVTKWESSAMIVVALTPEQVSKISNLLGSSEIFIIY